MNRIEVKINHKIILEILTLLAIIAQAIIMYKQTVISEQQVAISERQEKIEKMSGIGAFEIKYDKEKNEYIIKNIAGPVNINYVKQKAIYDVYLYKDDNVKQMDTAYRYSGAKGDIRVGDNYNELQMISANIENSMRLINNAASSINKIKAKPIEIISTFYLEVHYVDNSGVEEKVIFFTLNKNANQRNESAGVSSRIAPEKYGYSKMECLLDINKGEEILKILSNIINKEKNNCAINNEINDIS